ncbi:MAG: DUF2835 domain-containing protein, partial [Gammaproteobacteria bacterium]|nr:DUF2835 domain-containing protein [Gammaproteobacteria bacterium]
VEFVWSRDVAGVGVQFPINALRRFVEHDGVRGRFRLVTDQEHRLRRVERVSRS